MSGGAPGAVAPLVALRSAIAFAPTPMALVCPDGRVELANGAMCALLGRTEDELQAAQAASLFGEPDRGPFAAALARAREARAVTFDGSVSTADGGALRRHQLSAVAEPTPRVLWVALDPPDEAAAVRQALSAEKRTARALLEASRHKDEFIATLAHELRNPLAPIRTGLQILDRAPPDSPHARNARQMMKRQLRHIVRMVDDLLDVSRISRGKLEITREPVRLRSVIDDGLEASRAAVETAAHLLLVRHPPEPLWTHGDPTRLAQVVANLVNNAARYTPRGGRISVALERRGDEAVLTVSDNGVGISAEDLPHLFEMFTQAPGRESMGGLGVGLALVKQLVEMHGGAVEAASPGLGQGATFTVRLPLAPALATEEPVSQPIVAAAPRRVLVVDDNLDTGVGVATILDLAGHQTAIAGNGVEALALAGEFEPDVVLCDIEMPGMSGYEVAGRLRADPRHRGRLLVALTGRGGAEEQERSRAAGFDLHLTKPVDAAAVEALLERWTPPTG